ncbi:MAG: ABC transporter permease [Acidocella sp.]|nr:ABC transporter permease [Acidocella sp.]
MNNAALRQDGDVLAFSGDLVAQNVGAIWKSSIAAAKRTHAVTLVIDVTACHVIDTAGATLLLTMERIHGGQMQLQGAETQGTALIAQLRKIIPPPLNRQEEQRASEEAARAARAPSVLENLKIRILFFGETIVALMALPTKLRFLRGADFAHIADNAGLQAMPLVVMLGFLIGMILAFQSAIPMQQFGADLYVADLVALSLFRELGPLLVAVILAGRTGSAFAAELGTMQVNEEIAALTTMGIDPETMLVLPRVAAAVLVMPALVVTMDVAGLIGMGLVLRLFGFPVSAIIGQITFAAGPSDFLLGLFKSMVFAAAVAMIGCRAGLTTGNGPRAVGEAATSAVVGGIVATVLLDGLFAVLFYRMGL